MGAETEFCTDSVRNYWAPIKVPMLTGTCGWGMKIQPCTKIIGCNHFSTIAAWVKMLERPWQVARAFFVGRIYRDFREKKNMPTVSAVAKGLREEIRGHGGELSVEVAKEYIASQGLEGKNATFAALYGSAPRRHWWKKNGEVLELIEPAGAGPGFGPGSPGAGPVPPPVAALASPEDRVRATAVQLGISDKLAGTIAAYSSNFDLNSPSQIWGMLGGVPEVGVSARKRLFETLCRSQGLEPSAQLAQLVDSARVDGLQQPARRRTYIARAGEVMALDDGEEGLSFGQAIMVADQQLDKLRMAQAEAREPEGISSLDRILPGLSGKIADLLFAPARSAAGPGVPISLGGTNLTVSEETFLKFQDAETKRDVVTLVKDNLPKLWEVAQDLATATDRAYDKVMGGKGEVNAECASCRRRFFAPAGTTIFKCAGCGVSQDLASGQTFEEEEELRPESGQKETVPWQRCLNCGENFQSAGFRCPECAFEPSRLVADAAL